ncbi:MAG TPA: phosphoglycerate kinase [Phycisphaerae bacterium]|jgi:phosphoglycerate kinase
MKKTIADLNVADKRVLARVDFNVPQDESGAITDDRRIRAALPTIRKVLDDGGRLIMMSHLGRPEGKDRAADAKFTLAPVAQRLSEALEQPVPLAPDCVGPEVNKVAEGLRDRQVLLLENLRFHGAEQIKDKDTAKNPDLRRHKDEFARQIAQLGDIYVNDAFGTCHRDNASMLTVPQLMAGKPRVIGFLVEKELKFLGDALSKPARPFVVVLGGAKVSDKLGVIRALLGRCDTILIGGAMAYTFLAAEGKQVGKSRIEPELFEEARELRRAAGQRLKLPVDSIAAPRIEADAPTQTCANGVPDELMGLDIGPETIEQFRGALASAKTVFWNGPMGVFEVQPFANGTLAIARALAEATRRGAVTIIGGGDSAAAVDAAGLSEQITHISTGGGASLEFLEGKPFAAIEILDNA